MSDYCIVISTFSNDQDANIIINEILKEKLAACIQTININSHYTWNNEVCHDKEVLVLFKTKRELYKDLELKIQNMHNYDTPEIISIDIDSGLNKYFKWIDDVSK
ncbi:MAG: divalent-cation tolerance protein CutA [Bacilli bacterium]|nr:divalent-cation tolerance protein CutA [Bacilli bacterium]